MELKELIDHYGKVNKELTTLKKEADTFNKKLKEVMASEGLLEGESDLYQVRYQIRKSTSLDEDKVIKILKASKLSKGIVKNKPYIDEDALENAIYTGMLPQEVLLQIQNCKIVKESVALIVKEK